MHLQPITFKHFQKITTFIRSLSSDKSWAPSTPCVTNAPVADSSPLLNNQRDTSSTDHVAGSDQSSDELV